MKRITSFRDEYFFLSNFYPCVLIFKDKKWRTSEHLYQALKFCDPSIQEKIRAHPSKNLKSYVRSLESDMVPGLIKKDIMYSVVKLKFTQNEDIKQKLLNTGDAEIIEHNNWHDNYFGDCRCKNHCNTVGHNHLGKILMRVREELRNMNEIKIIEYNLFSEDLL